MGKRALRKRIESLIGRVHDHELKILMKRERANPNQGLVRHWEAEISAFQKSIESARRRLES
jgi:hypothetical protein